MAENKQLKDKELKDVNGAYIRRVNYYYICGDCGGVWNAGYNEKKCKYCGSINISRKSN